MSEENQTRKRQKLYTDKSYQNISELHHARITSSQMTPYCHSGTCMLKIP